VLEPYLATVILAGGALRLGGTEQQKSALLPAVAEGSLLLALAHAEKQARYNLADVATTARRDNEAWIIEGEKTLVLHGDVADKLVVSARVSGERNSRDGLALFVVEAGASGVSRRGYRTVDGMRAAEISFSGVRAGRGSVVGEAGKGYPLIERVFDGAIAALAAEAVGAMQEMHDLTVEYLKTRKQFGVPIGSFQALQHRAVDMLVELEQAKSMAMLATMSVDAEDPAERRGAVSQAKVQLGRSIRFVGQHAVQLHGGIGMTMEYKLGHYFKRATAIDKTFGDADHHLALLAAA
jgi:alkylation response protein AidB-like acyl-CoA dehydrogenase